DAGLAHTMLAVPLERLGAGAHLDTVCTMIDVDTVIMHPRLAFTLVAHTITPRHDGMRVSRPQPFLEAAGQAMGIERSKVIETRPRHPTRARRRPTWTCAASARPRPSRTRLPRGR